MGAQAEYEYDPHIRRFLDRQRGLKAEETFRTRRSDLKMFNQWMNERGFDLLEMNWLDLEEYFIYLKDEGYAPNTIASRFETLRALFSHLEEIPDSPVDETPFENLEQSDYTNSRSRKHDETDIVYVTREEKEQLAEHAPSPKIRSELVIRLLWQTGIRQSELARIRLDDIDREERRIENVWSPKANDDLRNRTVYYHHSLDSLLRIWLDSERPTYRHADDSEYLFLAERSDAFHSAKANRIVTQAAENAGIQEVVMQDQMGRDRYRITAHSLRHGFAVNALNGGMDIKKVSDLLGHSNLETTCIYLPYVDKDRERDYRENFQP